jgi:hypothetical protein
MVFLISVRCVREHEDRYWRELEETERGVRHFHDTYRNVDELSTPYGVILIISGRCIRHRLHMLKESDLVFAEESSHG